jgi:hypothetical protein
LPTGFLLTTGHQPRQVDCGKSIPATSISISPEPLNSYLKNLKQRFKEGPTLCKNENQMSNIDILKMFTKENVIGKTKAEMGVTYAAFIVSEPSEEDIVKFNQIIIDNWSNRGLSDIKDKAWKILRTLKYMPL